MADYTGHDFDSLTPDSGALPVASDPSQLATSPPISQGANNLPAGPTQSAVAPDHTGQDFDSLMSDEDKYGTMSQQLKTAAEGAAQGVAGPLAPLAETQMGLAKPEDIRLRAETNPITHYGAEALGLVLPAVVTSGQSAAARAGLESFGQALPALSQLGLVESAGKVVSEHLAPYLGTNIAAKVGTAAAKGFVENALIAGSDEVSRMILQDPNQSAETALSAIGLSGVLGAGIGVVSPLWTAVLGEKAGQLAADFKAETMNQIANPDPVASMTEELSAHMQEMDKIGSETYGSHGIRAEAIEKLAPEMHPGIPRQTQEFDEAFNRAIDKLGERSDPNVGLLQDRYKAWKSQANATDPADIFTAHQNAKRALQEDAGYSKLPSLQERPYINAVKSLAHDFKTGLEDKSVWGKVADIQASLNDATSTFIRATKDFKSLMTTKVMGQIEVDPSKVNTYLNQLGKPNAEIKATKLKNYLDASEQLKASVARIYDKLGVESPVLPTPLNTTMASLEHPTLGAKLSQAFLGKSLTGPGAGAAVGGLLGHLVGHGELGAIVGAHALGPFFNSVLPAIAKSVVSKEASGSGIKAAIDYASHVAKGASAVSKASKAVFKTGSEAIAKELLRDSDRAKIEKAVKAMQSNPMGFANRDSKLSNYMPEHGAAVSQATATALSYLQSLHPDQTKQAPLDSKPVPSTVTISDYNNAIQIAQNPLNMMIRIKDGTITPSDIKHLSSMYPSLYQAMAKELNNEMTNRVAKGELIPYKTRIGLSAFLGQPLDSTMTPSYIASAQMQGQNSMSKIQAQAQSPQPKPAKSSPALQKMSSMYKTPSQARESERTKQ